MSRRRPTRRRNRTTTRPPDDRGVTEVVVNSRMRRYGLTPEQAADHRAGTVLGILSLRGDITLDERETGERFEKNEKNLDEVKEAFKRDLVSCLLSFGQGMC